MSEGRIGLLEGNRPVQTETAKNGTAVKDSWFKGFLQGEGMWPGVIQPGSAIMITNAVLNDPPDSWHNFFDTQLTDSQTNRFGNAMNSRHTRARVDIKTEEKAGEKSKVVGPDFFQRAWNENRDEIGLMLTMYIHTSDQQTGGIQQIDPARIARFFEEPSNALKIEKLKRMAAAAKDKLLGPDTKKLADFYQKSMTPGATDNPEYQAELSEHKREHNEAFGGNWMDYYTKPKDGIVELAGKRIKDDLTAKFPDENLDWLRLANN